MERQYNVQCMHIRMRVESRRFKTYTFLVDDERECGLLPDPCDPAPIE
jgi:hypothetical protein